ncbi:unnamed protein product [Chondrus crispus]|uniref:Aminotransferase class I/classII large domain-containing protein n=1 Tax=Chondrus crispus TaxID=2769 RepID=R7QL45_CHOCR|nr:unnamed protein product [Chondrus crispus]CDF39242.1 unnamed protein product [Chondrus crispus]|eukprot:XP_005719153.1 unnamed protein product [Chondrus crispus]
MTATDPRLLPFSAVLSSLENEGAYAVMAAAAAVESATGKPVIHLEIGQPAFPTPAPVADAAIAAIAAGKTKYSSPRGVAPLRAAIASLANRHRGLAVTPQHVVVGSGAKPGLFLATLALVRGPHDHLLIPDPGFPTYRAMVAVANGTAVPVPLRPDMRSFDMPALEAAVTHRTRLVVLNSPGNPTGGVVPLEHLRRIAQLAVEHDFWVVSDEIYSQLCYEDTYTSIASPPGMAVRTVVVDGFSKSYCMTGWRLGWAIMPPPLAERVELLLVHSVGCTATFTQEAGIAALAGGGEVEMLRREYRKRRDIVVKGLNAIPGVRCDRPQGAFCAFADVRSFGRSSKEIADVLLQDGLVAVLPGTDFGEQGEGFIRLSYVSEEEEQREGLRRIAATLGRLRPVKAVA